MSHIFQLSQDIQVRSNEAQRETRRKEKLDRELKHSKGELEQKTGEIKSMQSQAQRYRDDIARLETQLKEQKVRIELIFLKYVHPLSWRFRKSFTQLV